MSDRQEEEVEEESTFVVPCRVESRKDGRRGILCYIGPLDDPSKPNHIYYGVDWDDSKDGKHDGLDPYTGVRRFRARHATSGSFLNDSKKLYGSQSFQKCVYERYFIDEEDMKRRGLLKILGLAGSKCGNFDVFRRFSNDLLRLVETLDVSNTMFTYWEDVFEICNQINSLEQSLKELNVSGNNRLICKSESNNDNIVRQETVKFLVADDSNLWENPDKVWLFPNLTSLYARRLKSGPFLTVFPRLVKGLDSLIELDVSHNVIDCTLPSFLTLIGKTSKTLQRLNANSCDFITSLDENEEEIDQNQSVLLLKLLWFGMSHCTGKWSWKTMDKIVSKMPNLIDLRCLNVRFGYDEGDWSGGEDPVHLRAHLIARLPTNVMTLNGSSISSRERIEAERRYVRYVWEQQALRHPKYASLLEKHGPPPTLLAASIGSVASASGGLLTTGGSASRTVKVDFVFPDNKKTTKSLPRTSTLMDIKRVAKALRKNNELGNQIHVNNREMSEDLSTTIDLLLSERSNDDNGSNLTIVFSSSSPDLKDS